MAGGRWNFMLVNHELHENSVEILQSYVVSLLKIRRRARRFHAQPGLFPPFERYLYFALTSVDWCFLIV